MIDSKTAPVPTGFDKLRAAGKQVPKRMVTARRAVRAFKRRVQTASAHSVPWPELVLQVIALRRFLAGDRDAPEPTRPRSSARLIDDSGGDV